MLLTAVPVRVGPFSPTFQWEMVTGVHIDLGSSVPRKVRFTKFRKVRSLTVHVSRPNLNQKWTSFKLNDSGLRPIFCPLQWLSMPFNRYEFQNRNLNEKVYRLHYVLTTSLISLRF